MTRKRLFSNDELMDMLAQIEIEYGFLSFDTIHRAHTEKPFEYPSERTIRRCLGGLRIFNTPDFRDKLKPYLDKYNKK